MTDARRGRRDDDVSLGEVWRTVQRIEQDVRKIADESIVRRVKSLEDWRDEQRQSRTWLSRQGISAVFAVTATIIAALVLGYLAARGWGGR